MRRRAINYFYLAACCTIFIVLSLPKHAVDSVQSTLVATLTPLWSPTTSSKQKNKGSPLEEIQRLQLENTLLKEEIVHIKNVIQHELDLLNEMKKALGAQYPTPTMTKLKRRHAQELQRLLNIVLEMVPARVIFRSPATWNSSFWIDVGTETNEKLGTIVVAKDSPVLVGSAVVGLIDFAGKKQSRVRLITDPELFPAVRVARALYGSDYPLFLAKGEIHGSAKQGWRKSERHLVGTGFNYDFADEEGAARDLRTGHPENTPHDRTPLALVRIDDLLVTSGLDGIFPEHLPIAKVTKVHPLEEGGYAYKLEAEPIAEDIDDLSLVFVIPPRGLHHERDK